SAVQLNNVLYKFLVHTVVKDRIVTLMVNYVAIQGVSPWNQKNERHYSVGASVALIDRYQGHGVVVPVVVIQCFRITTLASASSASEDNRT
ncbi:hypothetical protein STEG23_009832, partial [Scotinomys teguina]